MARTIVNKHFDESSKITREQFHENDDYAKGEIIISNEENPSIWVLDSQGKVKQITGTGSSQGDVSSDDLVTLISEITSAYIAADDAIVSGITQGYNNADSALKGELSKKISDNHVEVNLKVGTIIQEYKAADTQIAQSITTTTENILNHTVNSIPIKNDPVLDATHVTVGTYSELVLNGATKENIITNDTTQVALKKVENMNIASSLAFAAGLNDVNKKINELTTKIAELETIIASLGNDTNII
jgi:hypothetical protein